MSPIDVEVPFDQEQTLTELESTFVMPPDPEAAPVEDPAKAQIAMYSITTQQIESLRSKCSELSCATKEGYEATRDMIGLLRTTRTRIEKKRKQLNADAQAHIKLVNGVAKQLTTQIENMEEPLKQLKLEVDEAKERAKRAEEEAKKKAEEERLAAERAELEAELKAEREARAAERAAMEAKMRAEQEQLAAERRQIEQERAAFQRAEQERQAKIKAEREAVEKAERDRLEAEAAAKREAERLARLEALKPDVEKLTQYAGTIRRLKAAFPAVESPEASQALVQCAASLEAAAQRLENFQP